jgi:hypothetical protein
MRDLRFQHVSVNRWRGAALCGFALIAASLSLCVAGCNRASDDIETEYGERNEGRLDSSVNGYSVLAGMFAKEGHTVSHRSSLSAGLKESADVIVYAPDDFAPPEQSIIDWFTDWLSEKEGRTLIYIGRDFDAAPVYWRKIRSRVSPKEQTEVDRRLHEAEADFRARRSVIKDAECEWFDIYTGAPHRDVRTLAGPWADVDAAKVEIELNSRFERPDNIRDRDNLLESEQDVLVLREWYEVGKYRRYGLDEPKSQLITVVNGSFLVNLQLVNKEHRKLAAMLIDSVGKPSRVVFIESDDAARIRDSDASGDSQETAGMTDVFGVWPLSVILLQWAVVLALFCFSRWAIFGPPRDPPPPPSSDFSRHVGALAETWELTRDSSYAQSRWQYYQEHVRSESGAVASNRPPRIRA